MPRKARLDTPGTLHHVIIRGIERRPIVDDDKDRENFVSRLAQLAAETETGIFAWTLMTNHAHRPCFKNRQAGCTNKSSACFHRPGGSGLSFC